MRLLKPLMSKRKPVLLVCLVSLYAVIASYPSVITVKSVSVRDWNSCCINKFRNCQTAITTPAIVGDTKFANLSNLTI